MNYRTDFRSLVSVVVIATLCISAAPALGKGKPKLEPPIEIPVNYEVTWLRADGYDTTHVHDVDSTGERRRPTCD
jgi:hypothetical protein